MKKKQKKQRKRKEQPWFPVFRKDIEAPYCMIELLVSCKDRNIEAMEEREKTITDFLSKKLNKNEDFLKVKFAVLCLSKTETEYVLMFTCKKERFESMEKSIDDIVLDESSPLNFKLLKKKTRMTLDDSLFEVCDRLSESVEYSKEHEIEFMKFGLMGSDHINYDECSKELDDLLATILCECGLTEMDEVGGEDEDDRGFYNDMEVRDENGKLISKTVMRSGTINPDLL